jgi:predicted RNase H-like HicB family nuclease
MPSLPPTIRLNVLFYQQEGYWVAFCPELSVLDSANTWSEVRDGIQALCQAHVERAIELKLSPLDVFKPPTMELFQKLMLGHEVGLAVVELQDGGAPRELRIQMVKAA